MAGVAALLAAYPPVFLAVQYAGAAYLAYLAWQAFTAPVTDSSGAPVAALRPRQPPGAATRPAASRQPRRASGRKAQSAAK